MLFADEHVVTMMLALFAVGVGLGSMLAERLLHGEVSARFVPLAALRDGVLRGRPAPGERRPCRRRRRSPASPAFLQQAGQLARARRSRRAWRWPAACSRVPLYAILQHESEPSHRARVIAANNIINALAMTRRRGRRGGAPRRAADDGRALRAVRPRDDSGGARRGVGRCACAGQERDAAGAAAALSRARSKGLEHARAAMPHAVIAANHASFLDGLLLGAFLPGDPIFAVDTLIAKQWWARPFLALVNAHAGRSRPTRCRSAR